MAVKINSFALDISRMIRDLSEHSSLGDYNGPKEPVDLNKTVQFVCSKMNHLLLEKKAILDNGPLPTIKAIPVQMGQLFFHLIGNAVKFAKSETSPLIKIYAKTVAPEDLENPLLAKGRPG